MVHQDEIVQIVASIWMSILGLPVHPDPDSAGRLETAQRTFTGCVQLTGDYDGAVLLRCGAELARRLASVMFEASPESLTIEEIQDALGELTNMVAGNIKPLLPGVSRLSLPSVVEGSDYHLLVPGSEPGAAVAFDCGGEPLEVTLVRRAEG